MYIRFFKFLPVLFIGFFVLFPMSGIAEIQWRMTSSSARVISPPGSDPRAVCEAYGSTWQGIGGETVPGYASSFSLNEGSFVASCHVNSRDHRAGIQLFVRRTGYCEAGEVEYKNVCVKPGGDNCPAVGNPIQASSGNKYQEEMDYRGAGALPLMFSRYYNSTLGYWRHTYSRSVEVGAGQSVTTVIPVVSGAYLLDLPVSLEYLSDSGFSSRFTLPATANGVSDAQLINVTANSAQVIYEGLTGSAKSRLRANVSLTPYTSSEPGYEAITTKAVITGFEVVNATDDVELYDEIGKLTAIEQRGGLSLTMARTATELSVSDDFGRQLIIEYGFDDSSLNTNHSPLPYTLKSLTTPDGTVYTYQSAALHTETLSDGGQVHWAGNVSVMLPAEPGQTALSRLYSYITINDKSLLSGITDERGIHYVSWNYDSDGRATSSSNIGGVGSHTLVFNSDESTTSTNPLGKETIFHFDTVFGQRRLTSVEGVASAHCAGAVQALSYDTLGFLTSKTDWNGNVTTQTHDTQGRPLTIHRASGSPDAQLTSTTWHNTYRVPLSISAPGRTTSYTYDSAGNRTSMSVTDNATSETRTTSWTYNSFGQVLTMDGPRTDLSDVTTYTYYTCNGGAHCGQMATMVNALGHTTTYDTYNAHGQPTQITDANGQLISLQYNQRQWMTSVTVAGETTTIAYDPKGHVERVTQPDNTYIAYERDDADRVDAMVDAQGNRIEWTLDAAGNRIDERIKDPAGQIRKQMQTAFDELSRVRSMIPAHGGSTTYVYDDNSNLEQMTDADGRITQRQYDALDRLKKEIDALNGETDYVYDDQNNLISVTDPENLTTSYTYNGFSDQLSVTSPDTGTTSYTYDAAGNRSTQTDARGVTVSYGYDALNRLTTVNYPTAAENITYTYDTGANGTGRLGSVTDQSGVTAFNYDARGNVVSTTQTVDGQSYTTGYSYNGANRLVSMTYPNGRQLTYLYDDSGRIDSITSSHNGTVENLASGIVRLPFGPTSSITLGNGLVRTTTFDQDYRVSNILDSGILERNYGFSSVDNITAITDSLNVTQSQLFGYDDLDRLEFATGDYGDIDYTYDGVGNRLSRSIDTNGNTSTDAYSYNSGSHRLTSVGGVSYQYDSVGNTLDNGNASFTYNERNRMASATVAGETINYHYNALGQRVRKTSSSADTHYLYDLNGLLISEANNTGSVDVEYAYLDGQPLAMWAEPTSGNPCGPMSYDPAVDRALMIWQECDGTFHVVGAGGGSWANYTGVITSDLGFTNLTLISIGGADSVVNDPANEINYDIRMGGAWEDEFSFTANQNAEICISVETPSSGTSILVGSNRVPVTSPFNPVTLASCTPSEPVQCGDPDMDATVDEGLYIWMDCGGTWTVEASGIVNQGVKKFIGSITSSLDFTSITPLSLESNDSLSTDLTLPIDFTMKVLNPWFDDFEFTVDSAANLCVDVTNIPSGMSIYAGPNRTPVSPPFDPVTLAACN